MKNRLSDLNNHLFAQLEKLADEELTPEDIEKESKRSKAIVAVADQIVQNASLQLEAAKLAYETGHSDPMSYLPTAEGPPLIEGPRNRKQPK